METGRVYFLTFSTYGTRLPGRKQGSYHWDSSYIEPNERLHNSVENNLNEQIVKLSFEDRALVHDAFMTCEELFGWEIDALNVREEHVHIVLFTPKQESQDEIVRKLKTGATYALLENGRRAEGSRVWTKSYATTTIWNIGFWRRKVAYTLEEQGSNHYLWKSQFGLSWVRRIRAARGEKRYTIKDIYGGETRANRRAAFFRRLNVETNDQ